MPPPGHLLRIGLKRRGFKCNASNSTRHIKSSPSSAPYNKAAAMGKPNLVSPVVGAEVASLTLDFETRPVSNFDCEKDVTVLST